MDFNYYKKYFTEGSIGRYDMAPLYADPFIFKKLISDIIIPFKDIKIDKIAAIDATGFILGSAVAVTLDLGLILIRKGGKIPLGIDRKEQRDFIDYSGNKKILELDSNMIKRGEKVLLIDDWIETGAGAKASISLIEALGGIIVGIGTIGSDRNKNTENLFLNYNLHSIGINV